MENQWGRSVLINFLSTDLYESQGAALTNFATTLPKTESDLAQEYFKDPYHFGISEYEVAKQQLPKELQDKLPSVEEIEQRLKAAF